MKQIQKISLLIGFAFLLFSCTRQVSTNTNYAHLYNGKSTTIRPDYVVYHVSKEETELHFRINSNDILYARKDKTQPYQAKIKLRYAVYGPESKKLVLDSGTVSIEDETSKKSSKFLTGKITFKAAYGKNYTLRVTATDLNRNNSNDQVLNLKKTTSSSAQFFLVRNKETGKIVYNNYLNKPMLAEVSSNENKGKSIHILRYYREFPIAAPPFSNTNIKPFNYTPEESVEQMINQEGVFVCSLRDSGFVHLVMDTTKREGLTFFGFSKNFPQIKNVFGMVEPIRFISSNSEFEKLTSDSEVKKHVDNFWLTKCGSEERAREIIKKYYQRVQDANDVFTSYVEGWKTDRGMVSLIFGSPKTVRKARDEEIWFYGEENNALALQFTFVEVDNPFTDNDYKLLRSPSYKSNWYRAVDAWRSGRVYWAQ